MSIGRLGAVEFSAGSRPPQQRWQAQGSRAAEFVGLAAVVALAAVLRFYRIDVQSLWYDEGISAYQLTRDFVGILHAAAGDTHPPLYYWTLKVWAGAFGATEWGLRSLSASAGVGSVVLTWLVARSLAGRLAATLGALLFAVSPLAVYYSQETRMYGLVSALSLLAVWLAVHWLRSQRQGWTWFLGLYPIAAAAALYTQYLGALVLLALNLALAPGLARQPRRLRTWLMAQAATAALFLPWLPTFIDQLTHRTLNTSPRATTSLLEHTAAAVALGPFADASAWQIAAAALFGLAALGLACLLRRPGVAAMFGLLAAVPLAGVLAMGLRNGLFEVRYLTLSLPGLAMLAGTGMAALLAPRLRLVGVPIVALALAAVLAPTTAALERQYFDAATFRDDYHGVVRDIQAHERNGDAIVLNAGNQWEVFSFYYRGHSAVYQLPERRPIFLAETGERLQEIKERHPRVWMVLWASREGDPTGFIEEWFSNHAYQSSHAWYGTVQLLLYTFSTAEVGAWQQVDARFENGARLLGFSVQGGQAAPGETVGLTLFWQADRPISDRYKVFAHLLDARGAVVAQRDSEPAGTLRPTTTWQPGEEIVDNYGILLPPDLTSGRYVLEVGMYEPEHGNRPGIRDAGGRSIGDHLLLGQVDVLAR